MPLGRHAILSNYCFGGGNGRFMSGLTGEQLPLPFKVVSSFRIGDTNVSSIGMTLPQLV
jgi:hypothetical protein